MKLNLVLIAVVCAIWADVAAYYAAKPVRERHWYYMTPAIGGWIALHDKLNYDK